MKNLVFTLAAVIITITASGQSLQGKWPGILDVQGQKLTVIFNIEKNGETYSATMDSPDQGALGIPVENVKFENNILSLEAPALKMDYTGTVNNNFTEIKGTFTQSGNKIPLNLTKKEIEKKPAVRSQTPKAPFPYHVENIKFNNQKDSITLAGTLTLPKKGENFPAVILITGSGPQNRDEELFDHRPFMIIADVLTKRGIAVLRCDDRGIGESTGNFNDATSADFANDVLAGIEYLKGRKEINKSKIGLIGHSEGGMIAPLVASITTDVAFIVLMAAPGIPIDELMILQTEKSGELAGIDNEFIKKNSELQRGLYSVIKKNYQKEDLGKLLEVYLKDALINVPGEMKPTSEEETNALIKTQIKTVTGKWFQYFITFNPQTYLQKLKCPVLALNGSLDSQVIPKENLEGIEKSLKKGGNNNYKTVELKGLNHLFQEAKTGAFSEYNQIEHTHAEIFLETMSDWICSIVK